jgi:hypothetical protein
MKISVLCNSDGVIADMVSMPEGGPPASFSTSDPREQQIVIDVQDITEDMPEADVLARLLDIRDRHRVDFAESKLVPK